MKRDIVKIDREKCTGCGKCVEACAEGAIQMIDGKAVLVNEMHCDGLGACLPCCPAGAISVEERDVPAFSAPKGMSVPMGTVPMAPCPGSGPRRIEGCGEGELSQWPVQLRLVPETAPYFRGCDLLVAADCTAFACGRFHEKFIKGRITVIGCPKLDPKDEWEKLSRIVASNDVRSITVARMEVPCCSGIAAAAETAVKNSGKDIPVRIFTVHPDGSVTE